MIKHPGKRSKEDPAGRRNERVPLRLPVRLQTERPRTLIEATTADISKGGMFVLTAEIPVGSSQGRSHRISACRRVLRTAES